MTAHSGRNANTGIAQNGIFFRLIAASTYGGTGSGAAAGVTAAGAAAAVAAAFSTGALSAAGAASAAGVPPSSDVRRSLERLSRCSGTSVTVPPKRTGREGGSGRVAGSPATPTDTGHTRSNLDDAERAEPSIEQESSRTRDGEMSRHRMARGMSQPPRGGARQ